MSKKQNKEKASNKADMDMIRQWEKTLLPKEIIKLKKSVAEKDLGQKTVNICNKVENEEKLTQKELKYIKKFLLNYREAINKHDVEGAVESIEKHKTNIKTQQDLMDLFSNENRFKIKMGFPVDGIKTIFEFKVKKITDMAAVTLVTDHANLYSDVTEEEINIVNKQIKGEEITPEEQQVIEEANRRMLESQTENQVEVINNFLARQVTLSDDKDIPIETWQNFPFLEKLSLYIKARDILGLTERANEELFLVE